MTITDIQFYSVDERLLKKSVMYVPRRIINSSVQRVTVINNAVLHKRGGCAQSH